MLATAGSMETTPAPAGPADTAPDLLHTTTLAGEGVYAGRRFGNVWYKCTGWRVTHDEFGLAVVKATWRKVAAQKTWQKLAEDLGALRQAERDAPHGRLLLCQWVMPAAGERDLPAGAEVMFRWDGVTIYRCGAPGLEAFYMDGGPAGGVFPLKVARTLEQRAGAISVRCALAGARLDAQLVNAGRAALIQLVELAGGRVDLERHPMPVGAV